MFWNRNKGNRIIRKLAPVLLGFGKADRFSPDLLVEDGYDLSTYGLDARVLSLPGHSSGSIGILTANGDLFCGDLFTNTSAPALDEIMDDPAAAKASLERIQGLGIRTV